MVPFVSELAVDDLPRAIRNNVQMLMHDGKEDRPDGLFIIDDNLTEAASSGRNFTS